jgi:hypothetical protein
MLFLANGRCVRIRDLRILWPRDPVAIAEKRLKLENLQLRYLLFQLLLVIAVNPTENRHRPIVLGILHLGRELALELPFGDASKLVLLDVIRMIPNSS